MTSRLRVLAAAVLLAACSVGYRPNPPPPPAAAPQLRVAALLGDGRLVDSVAPTGSNKRQLALGAPMRLLRPLRGLAIDRAHGLVYALQPDDQRTLHAVDQRSWKEARALPMGDPDDRFTDLELDPAGNLYAFGNAADGAAVLVTVDTAAWRATRTRLRDPLGPEGTSLLVAGAAITKDHAYVVYGGRRGGYDVFPRSAPFTSACGAQPCGSTDGGIAASGETAVLAAGGSLLVLDGGAGRRLPTGFAGPVPGLSLAAAAGHVYALAPCDDGGLAAADLKAGGHLLLAPGAKVGPCGAVLRVAGRDALVASAPRLFTIGISNRAVEESPDLGATVLDALPI